MEIILYYNKLHIGLHTAMSVIFACNIDVVHKELGKTVVKPQNK